MASSMTIKQDCNMNTDFEVVNAMTEQAEWMDKTRNLMEDHKEIVLLFSSLEHFQSHALAKLCEAYHYQPPAHPAQDRWPEFQRKLDLDDFAAKEQQITVESVFVLKPETPVAPPETIRLL